MDAPAAWRDLIERLLREHARDPVSHGEIALSTVFDRAGDHYLLMAIGWDGFQRIHAPLPHLDLIDRRIWIQHDGTEEGIATELLAAGVPRERLVLAFKHPSRREVAA